LSFSIFIYANSFIKKTILCQAASGISFRLVHYLWLGTILKCWDIMPFVNQNFSVFFYSISIGGTWS